MRSASRKRLTPKCKVQPFQGRSQVYAWLRAHHAAVEALRAVTLCLWAELVLDMADDGLQAGTAGRVNPDNVRKTWLRVCRDVAAMEAARAAKPVRPVPPSRMAPALHPPLASPPLARPAPVLPVPRPQTRLAPLATPHPAQAHSQTPVGSSGQAPPPARPLPDDPDEWTDEERKRHVEDQMARLKAEHTKLDFKFRF